jgi:hypothetical protein
MQSIPVTYLWLKSLKTLQLESCLRILRLESLAKILRLESLAKILRLESLGRALIILQWLKSLKILWLKSLLILRLASLGCALIIPHRLKSLGRALVILHRLQSQYQTISRRQLTSYLHNHVALSMIPVSPVLASTNCISGILSISLD